MLRKEEDYIDLPFSCVDVLKKGIEYIQVPTKTTRIILRNKGRLWPALFMAFCLCLQTTLFSLSMPHYVWGGTYTLVHGHERELCQDYAKNLARYAHLPEPMACERLYHPDFPQFSTPTWQKLDIAKHFVLYEKIERYHLKGYLEGKELEKYITGARARVKNLQVTLYITQVDLDNDGKLENILALRSIACGPYWFLRGASQEKIDSYASRGINTAPYTSATREKMALYLLNNTLRDINRPLQEHLFGEGSGYSRELFFYKGQPYIDMFEPRNQHDFFGHGEISVFSVMDSHEPRLCMFEYLPDKKGNHQ
jgi:hypothetical protein